MSFFGKSHFGSKPGAVAQTKHSIHHAKAEAVHKVAHVLSHVKSALPHHPGQVDKGFGNEWGHKPGHDRDDDCDMGGKGGLFGGLKSAIGAKAGTFGSLFNHPGTGHAGWGKWGHSHDKDDCDPKDSDNPKDDDGADNGDAGNGDAGGPPGGVTGVSIPSDTSGITFHVDEDDDGTVNAYLYLPAEEGVDPATVSFDDYLLQLKDQLAESHPDLDPSTAVIKATIYSPTEGESYYYFNGTEFQALEDARYYEDFAADFGTVPEEDAAAGDDEEDDPDLDL